MLYIVITWIDYEGCTVEGLYSTIEKAVPVAKEKARGADGYTILSIAVDTDILTEICCIRTRPK